MTCLALPSTVSSLPHSTCMQVQLAVRCHPPSASPPLGPHYTTLTCCPTQVRLAVRRQIPERAVPLQRPRQGARVCGWGRVGKIRMRWGRGRGLPPPKLHSLSHRPSLHKPQMQPAPLPHPSAFRQCHLGTTANIEVGGGPPSPAQPPCPFTPMHPAPSSTSLLGGAHAGFHGQHRGGQPPAVRPRPAQLGGLSFRPAPAL